MLSGEKFSFIRELQGCGQGGLLEETTMETSGNSSNMTTVHIPAEFLVLSSRNRNVVIGYSIFFIVGSIGNVSVFISLLRQLGKLKWRITILIVHLCIADLIVTFFLIPSEIAWKLSIQWYGGDFLCKISQFTRVFGLYLSSMVVICISLDRFSAIVYPLKMVSASSRVKAMLVVAWVTAGLLSIPQVFVFRVMRHPVHVSFEQCVSSGFLSSSQQEIIYNVVHVTAVYFTPLLVILLTYGTILWKVNKKSREQGQPSTYGQDLVVERRMNGGKLSGIQLRRTTDAAQLMKRARSRTLRLTLTIVLVFVLCYSPYVLMTLWYMFHRSSAEQVGKGIQEGLFMMVVANSCLNPLVYGNYSRKNQNGPSSPCRWCWVRKLPKYSPRRTTDLLIVTSII